jgi:uncharacterized membrane-anchored protein YjiN (DUF445 family)
MAKPLSGQAEDSRRRSVEKPLTSAARATSTLPGGTVTRQAYFHWELVTERLAGWDETALVRELELQTGRDLQFIRINGALAGGLVGVAIYAVSGWLKLR